MWIEGETFNIVSFETLLDLNDWLLIYNWLLKTIFLLQVSRKFMSSSDLHGETLYSNVFLIMIFLKNIRNLGKIEVQW